MADFTFPDEIDLTLPGDGVDKQPPGNMCVGFSSVNVLECMANRHPAWKGKEFSEWFVYWYGRQFQGGSGDTGMRLQDAREAYSRYGICELKDFNPGSIDIAPDLVANLRAQMFTPVDFWYMPYYKDDVRLSVIRSLCFGMPVVAQITVSRDFNPLPGTLWRDMDHDASGPGFDHAVAIVGYSKRTDTFKFKNSWGEDWGDGGYGGLKAEKFYHGPQKAVQSLWRFESCPIPPVKVEGFMPGKAELSYEELAPARAFEAQLLADKKAQWMAAAGPFIPADQTGAQWIIDAAIGAHLTDRMVEILFAQDRGWLRQTIDALHLDRKTLVFEPLV